METKLFSNESIRIDSYLFSASLNFIDVKSLKDNIGLRVTNYSLDYQYIEIRRKNSQIALFLFSKKSLKKEVDFGWWGDAEVILAINEVKHKN